MQQNLPSTQSRLSDAQLLVPLEPRIGRADIIGRNENFASKHRDCDQEYIIERSVLQRNNGTDILERFGWNCYTNADDSIERRSAYCLNSSDSFGQSNTTNTYEVIIKTTVLSRRNALRCHKMDKKEVRCVEVLINQVTL